MVPLGTSNAGIFKNQFELRKLVLAYIPRQTGMPHRVSAQACPASLGLNGTGNPLTSCYWASKLRKTSFWF
jgi:hypothetical protein